MLKFPNCDFCQNRLGDGDKCNAYPDGIPLEAMIKAEEGIECRNGFYFVDSREPSTEEVKPGGLLSKMIDIIGS